MSEAAGSIRSMEDHAELKRLRTKQGELDASIAALRRQQDDLKKQQNEVVGRISREQTALNQVRADIQKLTDRERPPVVTEHAMLRYLERVRGLDLEALKHEIMPSDVEKQIKALLTKDGDRE